ncbi:PadR family transcriptional regulator [Paenibacillus ginsengarvi]|uniref:PadR family transcriptional regulator n=1 Tax=Paenibacillus ginsengarvi TaxID=400777 RepID=A0A3B0BYP2_9BACL|nr:PadR family transcriptional regulator [Paenibacillus ginsengarvi]RKN78182.1 PadR family transcriptional regulator [Paenibacillus ginsengarvi]
MTSQDVILGLLMTQNFSGYDIKMRFEKLFSYFFDASYGTIYPTLAKMEKEGLITKQMLAQEGRPNKNVYSITDKGREAFGDYMHSEIQKDAIKSDYLTRLFFGELAEPELLESWLRLGIAHMEEELVRMTADYARWESGMSLSQRICMEIGMAGNKAKLDVLLAGLERLRERNG